METKYLNQFVCPKELNTIFQRIVLSCQAYSSTVLVVHFVASPSICAPLVGALFFFTTFRNVARALVA